MASVRYKIDKWITKKILERQNELAQASTTAMGEKTVFPGMTEYCRRAAADGIVLLKNDGVLPMAKETRLAVFGRCQRDTFYVGYGSGGDVKAPYYVSYIRALQEAEEAGELILDHALMDLYDRWAQEPDNEPMDGFWGHWPMHYPEMAVTPEQARKAAEENDLALVILGRAAGEDRENQLRPGSYYLTRDEKTMLDSVTGSFRKVVVVMDCGNVIDLSWILPYGDRIAGLLYAWQGGMETGHGLCDVLTGKVNPSARLTDTIPYNYEDQPSARHFGARAYNEYTEDIFVGYRYFETFAKDKVLFPFGFGLSYTSFAIQAEEPVYREGTDAAQGRVSVAVTVTNTGDRPGREVLQAYISAPQGKLGKAARSLTAFAKTRELLPGESQQMTLSWEEYAMASFDDSGVTGSAHSYVLESGTYRVYVGSDVRSAREAGSFTLEKQRKLQQLQGICGVPVSFDRMHALEEDGKVALVMEPVPVCDYDLRTRISSNLPAEIPPTGDRGILLSEVASGSHSLEEFTAQLTDPELEALTRGFGPMNAPQGTPGNAGAFAGILPELERKGVPPVVTTDGPGGIRINAYTSLLPCGTALASSWDPAMVEGLYRLLGKEMEFRHTDILLGAGMNIHRNPLCGRNFEYFSEDPLVSGKFGAAFTRGIQSRKGKAACPKHFACNNQEVNRNYNDSRLSERALREIYLKGFEIMVKESGPKTMMSSYNKINGVWNHYNYDLITTVLRGEWGYQGMIMTDWWMRKAASPEFPKLYDNAYRVRSQVDLLMPGDMKRFKVEVYKSDGTLLKTLGQPDGITRGEIQRCAMNTLRCALYCMEKAKD